MGEHLLDRPTEPTLHSLQEASVGDCRQLVEQLLELTGDVGGKQILAHGEDLPELDVGRPQDLEAPAKLNREALSLELAADRQARDRHEKAQQDDPNAPPLPLREPAQPGRQSADQQPVAVSQGRQQPPDQPLVAGIDVLATRLAAPRSWWIGKGHRGGARLRSVPGPALRFHRFSTVHYSLPGPRRSFRGAVKLRPGGLKRCRAGP